MCGIVGFWDKSGGQEAATGPVVLTMLEALACRGPDSAGVALIGPAARAGREDVWSVRITPADERALDRLAPIGELVSAGRGDRAGNGRATRCVSGSARAPGITPLDLERASVPAAAAWKFSAWESGSTWSSRSARRASSRRPTPSRPGRAPWRSATPECRRRAGSTSATLSRSGLTACPTWRPFTTAT